jgi:hypothetical protein
VGRIGCSVPVGRPPPSSSLTVFTAERISSSAKRK